MEQPFSIALIGFRTTGKSVTGRILAHELGLTFVDMDEQLTESFGESIEAWVRKHGWRAFREAESKLLEKLSRKTHTVVATGGGIILSPVNREVLRRCFFVVWLEASPETIQLRMTHDPQTSANRPPLTELPMKEEIESMLRERTALYEESCDLRMLTEGLSPGEVAARIITFLGGKK